MSPPSAIKKYEIWDFSASGPNFSHVAVYFFYENGVSTLQIQAREDDIRDEDLDSAQAIRIPSDHLLSLPQTGMRQFTGDLSEIHIKGPNLGNYQMLQCNPADLLLHEVLVHEKYLGVPHPNITLYLGCLLGADGRVRGLCFKKYVETLQDRIDLAQPVNIEKLYIDIQTGMDYLHARGLVHNDLNPANIMFDEEGTAVIIDYDSCVQQGKPLGVKPGVYPLREIAEYENDKDALDDTTNSLRKGRLGVGHNTENILYRVTQNL